MNESNELNKSVLERVQESGSELNSIKDLVTISGFRFMTHPAESESYDMPPIAMLYLLTRIENYYTIAKEHIVMDNEPIEIEFFDPQAGGSEQTKTLDKWIEEFINCGLQFIENYNGFEKGAFDKAKRLWTRCMTILGVIGLELWW